jgi:citrate lyase subunit beta/citryl-CoA lyase
MSLIRSVLFAPANRPDLARKFPRFGADVCVLDLEDGTPEAHKTTARDALGTIVDELRAAQLKSLLYVRINGARTAYAAPDLAAALDLKIDGVMVPKLGSRADVRAVEQMLLHAEQRSGRQLRAIGLIETTAGVLHVEQVARYWRTRLLALAFGAEDFVTDIGGRRRPDSLEVLYARSRVVLAASAHGISGLDQVYAAVNDSEGFALDAAFGRDLGYVGKMCITPKQVELANQAFSPSTDEIDRSRRLIRAYSEAKQQGRGTIEYEGMLVDEPMLRRAEAVVAWDTESDETR